MIDQVMEVEVDFSALSSPLPRSSKETHHHLHSSKENHLHHGSKETFHSSRSSVSKDANLGHSPRTTVSKEPNPGGHTSRTSATSAASACSSLVASSSGCSSLPASPLQVDIFDKFSLALGITHKVFPGFQVTRRSSCCSLFSS